MAKWQIYNNRDRFNPITWSDTYAEAVSLCKTMAGAESGVYGVKMPDGRTEWYDADRFLCCCR